MKKDTTVNMTVGSPIRLLLAMIPSVGLWGIWWTAGLTWCISAIFCMLRYFFWNQKIRE